MKGVAAPALSQVLPEIVLLPGYCSPLVFSAPLQPQIWKSPARHPPHRPRGQWGRSVGLLGCELNCQSLIPPSRGRYYRHELCAAEAATAALPLPLQI